MVALQVWKIFSCPLALWPPCYNCSSSIVNPIFSSLLCQVVHQLHLCLGMERSFFIGTRAMCIYMYGVMWKYIAFCSPSLVVGMPSFRDNGMPYLSKANRSFSFSPNFWKMRLVKWSAKCEQFLTHPGLSTRHWTSAMASSTETLSCISVCWSFLLTPVSLSSCTSMGNFSKRSIKALLGEQWSNVRSLQFLEGP